MWTLMALKPSAATVSTMVLNSERLRIWKFQMRKIKYLWEISRGFTGITASSSVSGSVGASVFPSVGVSVGCSVVSPTVVPSVTPSVVSAGGVPGVQEGMAAKTVMIANKISKNRFIAYSSKGILMPSSVSFLQ